MLGSGLDRSIPVLANPDLLQSDLCDEHWCNGFALLHPFAFRAHATGFQGFEDSGFLKADYGFPCRLSGAVGLGRDDFSHRDLCLHRLPDFGIDTAVLPALFVASGFSAGGAAVRLVAMAFGAQREDAPMHQLHVAEYPIILVEAMCIFMIAVSLITGTEAAQLAFTAFTTGTWSCVFWFGAIFIGMVVPITLSFFRSAFCFYTGCTAAIVGMMCLRLFILYAGQLNGLN